MNTLKSEFIKLITIRASYVMALVIVALVITASVASILQQNLIGGEITPSTLESSLFASISVAAQLAAVFAVILISHEYRYNLIHHTLTTNRSRSVILLAKMAVTLCYGLAVTAIAALVGYLGSIITFNYADVTAVDQVIDVTKLVLHSFVYVSSYLLIGLLLGLIFRTIVAPVVILILAPGTIEPLLGLLLNENQKYLPFTSVQSLVVSGVETEVFKSIFTISIYLVIGWTFIWYRFHHRDAS